MALEMKDETPFRYYFGTYPVLPEIEQRISLITESVCQGVKSDRLPFSLEPGNIQKLLVALQNPVDEKVRIMKMKEVESSRKELEKKLDFLNLELNLITNQQVSETSVAQKKKLSLRDPELKASVKKVTKEWQELQQRRDARMAEIIEKTRKREEQLRNEEKVVHEQLRREKLQQMAQKIEKIQARMKERETQLPKEKEEMKALLRDTPVILRKMNEARENEAREEQERIANGLATIKEKFKPLDPKEIESHAKAHDEMMLKRLKEKEIELTNQLKNSMFKPSYRSPLHDMIIEEEKSLKNPNLHAELLQKKQEASKKMKEYQEKVKAKFLPEIDPDKKKKLEEQIFKLNHPAFKFFIPKEFKNKGITEEDLIGMGVADKNPRTVGKSYLQFAKMHKKVHPNARSMEKLPSTMNENEDKRSLKSSKYENYLKKLQLSQRRDEIEGILASNDLNPAVKKEKLVLKAEVWEDEAERKDKLQRVRGNHDLSVEADELRVKAMKAKLAFLNNE